MASVPVIIQGSVYCKHAHTRSHTPLVVMFAYTAWHLWNLLKFVMKQQHTTQPQPHTHTHTPISLGHVATITVSIALKEARKVGVQKCFTTTTNCVCVRAWETNYFKNFSKMPIHGEHSGMKFLTTHYAAWNTPTVELWPRDVCGCILWPVRPRETSRSCIPACSAPLHDRSRWLELFLRQHWGRLWGFSLRVSASLGFISGTRDTSAFVQFLPRTLNPDC